MAAKLNEHSDISQSQHDLLQKFSSPLPVGSGCLSTLFNDPIPKKSNGIQQEVFQGIEQILFSDEKQKIKDTSKDLFAIAP